MKIVLILLVYFIIGLILTGIFLYYDNFENADKSIFAVMLWPTLAIVLLVIGLHKLTEYLAVRIGKFIESEINNRCKRRRRNRRV